MLETGFQRLTLPGVIRSNLFRLENTQYPSCSFNFQRRRRPYCFYEGREVICLSAFTGTPTPLCPKITPAAIPLAVMYDTNSRTCTGQTQQTNQNCFSPSHVDFLLIFPFDFAKNSYANKYKHSDPRANKIRGIAALLRLCLLFFHGLLL